jgi:predicted enzyme related to lactoylglutathione lyase
MQNRVTWFEIIGKDSAGLQKFYKDVFGWKLTPPVAEMGNYSMLADQGPDDKGAGGGIGGSMNDENRVSVYVEVDDPQKYLDRAAKAGATTLMPVTQITGDTTIAMFRDPAGNTTGILKANPRRPEPRAAARAATSRSRAAGSSRRTRAASRSGKARSSATKAKRTTRRAKRR